MKTSHMLIAAAALLAAAAQAQTIRAVTEATPYTYVKDGKVAGPATRVVEATLAKAGLNDYRLALYPWARAYDMALNEPNVLIYLIARTPAREKQFKWAGEIMKVQYHLFKLKERGEVAVRSLQDAKKYTIGVMRDDVRSQYLQGQGFTKLVVSAQWNENFNKLLNRQVDLVPLNDGDARALCEEAKFNCSGLEKLLTLHDISTGLYMAYSAATADDLVARTRAAFEKVRAEGTVKRIMGENP